MKSPEQTAKKGGSSSFFRSNNIFPKLTIGQPNDKYEQEADAMANKVTAMPEPGVVQRKCAECEAEESMQTKPMLQKMEGEEEEPLQAKRIQRMETEEEEPLQTKRIQKMEEEEEALQTKRIQRAEEEEPLQAKSESGGTQASPALQNQLQASKGGGSPLPDSTNQFMSNAFGRDFSDVRVHNNSSAQEMNQGIQAKAFTHGSDIYFNKGQYSPETSGGKNLLAHELTHVVQQGAARRRVQRQAAAAPARIRNCGRRQSSQIESARDRAKDFVDVAISRIRTAPRAGTNYATALNRHFITPTAAQRATIRARYVAIRNELVRRRNFLCDFGHRGCSATTQAFWIPSDDNIHICRSFFRQGITCRAIILIHEAAHDVGVDIAGAHKPNRGSAQYPTGNTAPPGGETTARRMGYPDTYAFFAAHIWRNTDTGTNCF